MYLSRMIEGRLALLVWIFSLWSARIAYGVVGMLEFGTEVVCTNSPGLIHRQRDMCRSSPDAMVAVGDGIRLATEECRYQFRNHRWNCTGIENPSSFGHVVVVGSREAAFTYAISSAGVAYSVTAACARGNISACGCDPGPKPREPTPAGWKWGGCSVDVNFGVRFSRKFLDVRELEGDERSLMNLHNNKAGRKAVKSSLIVECKCHGVSGSCTMKTCWKTLPTFRQVGDILMKKYYRARPVASQTGASNMGASHVGASHVGASHRRRAKRQHLVLTKGKVPVKREPKKSELVYLQMSPNYCERDLAAGSLGTAGRRCNRTSRGIDGCDLMCCGRGYNTHQYTRTFQCRCNFVWCCKVDCDTCSERTEEYTCK
ncbi:unnamed protein product [Phaedon cochleariae]|uniref:Protein Wnt n=1 Tax=Phaedon cochleariae TaxID=80249 RepID=A0A9P0DM60_PHACE|nr:unnamed protein product [Phaedon cochleariae]